MLLKRVFSAIKHNPLTSLFFLILLAIFLINSLHFSYPDEFVKIIGGRFINQGMLPYRDFFSNHGPIGYFFSSIVTLFSGASFVKFRVILNITYWLMILAFYLFIRKRFGKNESNIFLVFSFLIGLIATFVWGHMLLADSLSGYWLLGAYITLFLILFNRQTFRRSDLILLSILSAFSVLTSLTYLYAVLVLYFIALVWFLKTSKKGMLPSFILIISSPYLIFLVYLLITGSLQDYYYQSISLITNSYLTSDDLSTKNPLRLALIIFSKFFDTYKAVLVQTKELSFSNPFTHTLALSNFLMIIYLLINRRFSAFFLTLGLLIFVNARSNPLNTGDTDYQAIPYQYFSIFNGLFLLNILWADLKNKVETQKTIVYGFMLIFLGTYFVFFSLFLFHHFFEKAFNKYMGNEALIYDRPQITHILNKLINKNDYYYIGPFAPEEYLYAKGKLSSRYHFLIPPMDQDAKFKEGLLSDLNKNKPKVVVFDTGYSIQGTFPGDYVVNFLKENYFTLSQIREEGIEIKVTNEYGLFLLDSHFFFDKSRRDEILQTLAQNNIIEIKTPQKK